MPSKAFHVRTGVIAGLVVAASIQERSESPDPIIEIFGAAVGGYLGARLPDLIDPPTSPNHRSIGHGLIPVGVITKFVVENLVDFRNYCFDEAVRFQAMANESRGTVRSVLFEIWSSTLRFIAGLAGGVLGGYISHLGFDFLTPKCLPVFC